jgi:hypothetical protein
MVPTFIQVAFTLKSLIEDKVNLGESEINLTPHISKATLDVIGLVGKKIMIFSMLMFTHSTRL